MRNWGLRSLAKRKKNLYHHHDYDLRWVHLAASICTEWTPASPRRPRTIHRWELTSWQWWSKWTQPNHLTITWSMIITWQSPDHHLRPDVSWRLAPLTEETHRRLLAMSVAVSTGFHHKQTKITIQSSFNDHNHPRSYRAYFSHLMDSSCSRLHRAQGTTRFQQRWSVNGG